MKFKKLSRRGTIRALSYLCALLVVMAGFIASANHRAGAYRDYIEQEYQHNFFELTTCVGKIDTAMRKGLYASSSPMITQLAAEIAREAAGAQAALAKLPFRFEELERTSKFLSQAGDFSSTLAKISASGDGLKEEQRGQLRELSASAETLAATLADLQTLINEENLKVGEIIRAGAALEESDSGLYFFVNAFKEVEEQFPESPSLIYDGPFSEHISRREPKLLEGKGEITAEEAEEIASKALGLDRGILRFDHEVGGTAPQYSFLAYLDGGEISASVTKQGGYMYSILSSRESGNAVISPEEGIGIAQRFLQSVGYDSMRESYWTTSGNFLLVNFAYLQGDIICYPDLIKVGVALDTGKIVQLDAAGYVMNHPAKRDISAADVTLEEAGKNVVSGLTLENSRTCVIPSPGGGDIACHELACLTEDGVHVMLYINVSTGFEEKILVLIEDETGTLAY